MKPICRVFALLAIAACRISHAQAPPTAPATTTPNAAATTPPAAPAADDAGWIRTKHSIMCSGKALAYASTVGLMPIRNDTGDIEGRMFFTAYRLDGAGPAAKRPITFAFNGGPGSASVYLHVGALGPRRVNLLPNGSLPPPPYSMVDNDESILPESDLVMIDPIGTGFSRPEKQDLGKKFYGVKGDIDSVGQFIRNYLTDENRLLSPIFVLGESYGGVRGSGLAQWLTDAGIGLNGLILVSPVISSNILWGDQSYAFYLPSYSAVAWYHHKLSPEMQRKPVEQVVRESQTWVYDQYLPALLRGSALADGTRHELVSKLAQLSGLSARFIENSNLRIEPEMFFKELLKDQRYTVGRYDGRLLGIDRAWADSTPEYDPSDAQVNGPIMSVVTSYIREDLGYKTSASFWQERDEVNGAWTWEPFGTDRSEALRQAMHKNAYLKLFVAMGYYDLACPLTTVEQTLNQMALDTRLAGNISRGYYPAGHMMYIDHDCRVKFHSDVARFIASASAPSLPSNVRLIGPATRN